VGSSDLKGRTGPIRAVSDKPLLPAAAFSGWERPKTPQVRPKLCSQPVVPSTSEPDRAHVEKIKNALPHKRRLEHGIEHRFTKNNHPRTNGKVERMNALRSLTPFEHVVKCWADEPKRQNASSPIRPTT